MCFAMLWLLANGIGIHLGVDDINGLVVQSVADLVQQLFVMPACSEHERIVMTMLWYTRAEPFKIALGAWAGARKPQVLSGHQSFRGEHGTDIREAKLPLQRAVSHDPLLRITAITSSCPKYGNL